MFERVLNASSDAMDAMNDADANTDADDPGTPGRKRASGVKPAYERAALLWQGKCLWWAGTPRGSFAPGP
jgi:hypothetical protein